MVAKVEGCVGVVTLRGKRQNFVDKGQNVWSLRSTKDLMGISVHCFSLYIAFLSFFPVAL